MNDTDVIQRGARNTAVFCAVVALFGYHAIAEEPFRLRFAEPVQAWQISRYPELTGRGVRCVAQDHYGNLWFGLAHGVTCYDGYRWEDKHSNSGLPSLAVESIAVSSDNVLYAATSDGLYRHTGGKWKRHFPSNPDVVLPLRRVQWMGGELWGCGPLGLVRWGDQTTIYTSREFEEACHRILPSAEVRPLPDSILPRTPYLQGSGIVMAGPYVVSFATGSPARESGLEIGDRVVDFRKRQDVPGRLSRSSADPIVIPIQKLDGRRQSLTITARHSASEQRYRSPAVHHVLKDSRGQLWAGVTSGYGAMQGRVIFSEDDGATWRTWSTEDGLKVGNRPTILEGRDGKIHVASANNYSSFDGKRWSSTKLLKLTGMDYDAAIVEMPSGSIWVSGMNRLHVNRNGHWQTFDTRSRQLPNESHRFLIARDEGLWVVGANQAAARIANSPSESFSLDEIDYHCTDLEGQRWFIDTQQRRVACCRDWTDGVSYGEEDGVISTPQGIITLPSGDILVFGSHNQMAALSTFDGESWRRCEFPQLAQEFSRRATHISRDGRVWLGAKGKRLEHQLGGVIVGTDGDWEHLQTPEAPNFSTCILELPDGRMLFGGGYGMAFYQDGKWSRPYEEQLCHPISCGATDSRGNLWLATRTAGVLLFRDGAWRQLSMPEGLAANDVAMLTVDAADRVWASTSGGLCRFDGDRFCRVPLPNETGRLSMRGDTDGAIWFNGRHRYVPDTDAPIVSISQDVLELTDGSDISVEWKGVDAFNRTAAKDLLWSYRIDGDPWSPFQATPQVTLRGLAPGVHGFEVRAQDADLNQSLPTSRRTIVVHPVFWQRTWFLFVATVLGGVMSWQAVSLVRRGLFLKHTNRELELARRQLAEQYAEQLAQFRTVCDCLPAGIFVTDLSGEATYFNRALIEMLGMDVDEARGDGWAKAIHPEDLERVETAWRRSLRRGGGYVSYGRFLHENGKIVWFEAVANPIIVSGESIGYVGAVDNVTQRIKSEREILESNEQLREALEQLQQAQVNAIKRERLSALGQMAAGVAHDVNNSLAPLLTYADLLANSENLDAKHREWVNLIRLGVTDTAATVRRLEHFYRESHNPEFLESTELAPLIEQVIELTRPRWSHAAQSHGKLIKVETQISAQPTIAGNPSQLRSVLTNLLFNAVDAIEREGTILFRLTQRDDRAILEVQDDGKGMSKKDLSRCLEPFYTSKDFGSGLGLSECHGVVRQHGGVICLQSEVGQGTVVTIELPLTVNDSNEEQPSTNSPSQRELPATNHHLVNLLLIDDDESVRASTQALLQTLGCAVTSVEDGRSGINALESAEFHIVVCDQGLPGMSGLEVVQEVKARWPDLPVVLVSGWSLPDVEDGAQPDAFLEKPFHFDDLRDQLGRFLPMASEPT